MDTKKCYNEIELRAQNAGTILGFIVSTIGRAYVIEWRERFFTLTSYNLKLESTIFVIRNCASDEWIPEADPVVIYVCGVGSAHNAAT